MLQIKIHISDVDYGSLSDKAIPLIIERLNNSLDSGKAVKVLAGLGNMPKSAAAAALKLLPQSTKDDIAVYMLSGYGDKMVEQCNSLFGNRNIPLYVNSVNAVKYTGIELTITFDNVDYDKLIVTAYPQIIKQFADNEKYSKIFSILNNLEVGSEKLIQAALGALSSSEKDEMVSSIVAAYEQEILSLLKKLTENNGVNLTFNKFLIIV